MALNIKNIIISNAMPQTRDARIIANGPANAKSCSELVNSVPMKPRTEDAEDEAPDVTPPIMPVMKFPRAMNGMEITQKINSNRYVPIFPLYDGNDGYENVKNIMTENKNNLIFERNFLKNNFILVNLCKNVDIFIIASLLVLLVPVNCLPCPVIHPLMPVVLFIQIICTD